jgi:multiple sugar transport system permease protein
VAPAAIAVGLVLLYPLGLSLRIAAFSKFLGFGERFVGFGNLDNVLSDPTFGTSLWVTVEWTVFSVIGQMVVGFVLALLLTARYPGVWLFRAILLLPWAVPNFIAALTWTWMYSDRFGIISNLLVKSGILQQPILWLADRNWALIAVIVVNIWKNYPFVMLMLLAGLQAIPAELYEAAKVDGASVWQRLRHVTWPMVLPVVLIVLLLRLIHTFNTFELIFLMTEGGPGTQTKILTIDAYIRAFRLGNLGQGSTVGLILFVITMAFCLVYVRSYQRTLRGEV